MKNISITSIAFLILAVFFLFLPNTVVSTGFKLLMVVIGLIGAYIFRKQEEDKR